jgi:hypothetical protein
MTTTSMFSGILCAMLIFVSPQDDPPDWVTESGVSRRYPEPTYMTGFGIARLDPEGDPGQGLALAVNGARRAVAEKIRVRIQNTATARTEETAGVISMSYYAVTQSSSALQVEGLQSETYLDREENTAYAFAYIRRDRLAESYARSLRDSRDRLDAVIADARVRAAAGDRAGALDRYLQCFPLFREVEEAEAVLIALDPSGRAALNAQSAAEDQLRATEIHAEISRLQTQPVRNLEDAAWLLAHGFRAQVDRPVPTCRVEYFTFADSRLASSFSRFFREILEARVAEATRWGVVAGEDSTVDDTSVVTVRGSYWLQPAGMRVLASLWGGSGPSRLASAEVSIPDSILRESGLTATPPVAEEAFERVRELDRNETVTGGLELAVSTNRGTESIVFLEGERMNVNVRVNMPCYLRLVYHQADSSRVLLLDNVRVPEAKVDQDYQLPFTFECGPPFGAEVLQILARTTRFDPLPVEETDGVKYIRGDLRGVLARTRGTSAHLRGVLQAEQRIVLTTMQR